MAKKKKTQLKPVARGFATTSVAKKVVPEPEPEAETAELPPVQDSNASSADNSETTQRRDGAAVVFDPQEQALQELVDKFQDRVEKDITRTVKVRPF